MKKILFFILISFISTNSFCQTDKDFLVVSSFWQGSANNCASIALIKAAMLKYGYKNMFIMSQNKTNYNLTLKNGTRLTISENERQRAQNVYTKFELEETSALGTERDTVLFYAYLAYAAIAKNIVKNGYWSCIEGGSKHYTHYRKYEDAINFISRTSFCTDYSHRLLGFKIKGDKIYDFKTPEDINQKGVILYSWAHTVATHNNKIDCHGEWIPITPAKVCSNKFEFYVILD